MTTAHENFQRVLPAFTSAGLTGLADNAADANRLGELLAGGHMTPEILRQIVVKYAPLVGDGADPQALWSAIWEKVLGRPVDVPPVPDLRPKTVAAFREYGFKPMFLPDITEADYPDFFQKPKWGKFLTEANITRRKLPGRWVAVETIRKPHYNEPDGYGADPLGKTLGLKTRFKQSWDKLDTEILPAAAKLLGVSEKSTRLPSVEEWNLIGNLLNWLRKEMNEDLPDLGSTNSWEWCENACGSGDRLITGGAEDGGLAYVDCGWHDDGHIDIAFRVLVVL